jgi:hypothetical protein
MYLIFQIYQHNFNLLSDWQQVLEKWINMQTIYIIQLITITNSWIVPNSKKQSKVTKINSSYLKSMFPKHPIYQWKKKIIHKSSILQNFVRNQLKTKRFYPITI